MCVWLGRLCVGLCLLERMCEWVTHVRVWVRGVLRTKTIYLINI